MALVIAAAFVAKGARKIIGRRADDPSLGINDKMDAELIGGVVAALLTVMVFSYLLGANPLWKIAQSLLVGVSVGYVSLVVLTQVVAPQIARIIVPAQGTLESDRWLGAVPVALGLLCS